MARLSLWIARFYLLAPTTAVYVRKYRKLAIILMTSIFDDLNTSQRDAVTSPASVLQVLAPPGSGKTKTLTSRVAYHIDHDGIEPSNIIVCTFTIKAAREMKERIRKFIGQGREKRLILGTFHSVARRYVVTYGHYTGIPKNFGVADASDSLAIIKRIVKNNDFGFEPAAARARISRLKARCISPEDYIASWRKEEEHRFSLLYSEYETCLRASNLLDYDDLLLRCKDLLHRYPQCVSNVEAVLIDEFQDTNVVQYDLMCLFAQRRRKVTIVGDPDQSIYGFRSAELENLDKMQKKYKEFHLINLEENYRSSCCILETAQQVIEQDESRHNKKLRATHCRGERPTFRKIPSAATEAAWIVAEINRCRALTVKLLGYSDFAILLRSAHLSRPIEHELGKAGIPYRMVGGVRFFDRKEVKQILDYLRVIHQPNHNDAIVRIINVPSRRVSGTTVEALVQEAREDGLSLWDVVRKSARGERKPRTKLNSSTQKGLEAFANVILTLQTKHNMMARSQGQTENNSVRGLIECLIKKLSYKDYLRKAYPEDPESRWANVQELMAQASEASLRTTQNESPEDEALPAVEGIDQREMLASENALAIFLGNVALSTEIEKRDDDVTMEQVTISTIHAAKGLEWPVIFIPSTYDGSIPHSRAEDTDEERRLLYVGMTRAQALLFLSCPMKNSEREQVVISRFVDDPSTTGNFSPQGPTYDKLAIRSLAQILNRDQPSEEAIEEARAVNEHVEDDWWPLDGEEPDPEKSNFDSYLGRAISFNQPYAKRCKIEGNASGGLSSNSTLTTTTATFQNYEQCSVPSAACQSGFVSASTHFQQTRETMLNSRDDTETVQLKIVQGEDRGPKKSKQRLRQKQSTGQGNIISFFNGRADTQGNSNRLPFVLQPSAAPKAALQEIKNNLPIPRPSSIPTELAARKPSTAPLRGRPCRIVVDNENERSKRVVLLSSSPNKAEENVLPDIGNRSPPLGGTGIEGTDLSSFKQAATFHTTSIAQLQAQPKPLRRTLGTRRSIHSGWPPPKRTF